MNLRREEGRPVFAVPRRDQIGKACIGERDVRVRRSRIEEIARYRPIAAALVPCPAGVGFFSDDVLFRDFEEERLMAAVRIIERQAVSACRRIIDDAVLYISV